MALDIQTLHEWFNYFNQLCFEGKLPLPRLMLSKSRTQLGSMTCRRERRHVFSSVSTYTIRVSTYYDCTNEELQDVLLHEMIHYYISLNKLRDTSPHGRLFCEIMDNFNRKYHRHMTISSRMKDKKVASTQPQQRTRLILALEMTDRRYFLSVVNPHYAVEIRNVMRRVKEIKNSYWIVSADSYFNDFPTVRTLRARKVDIEVFQEKVGNGTKFSF